MLHAKGPAIEDTHLWKSLAALFIANSSAVATTLISASSFPLLFDDFIYSQLIWLGGMFVSAISMLFIGLTSKNYLVEHVFNFISATLLLSGLLIASTRVSSDKTLIGYIVSRQADALAESCGKPPMIWQREQILQSIQSRKDALAIYILENPKINTGNIKSIEYYRRNISLMQYSILNSKIDEEVNHNNKSLAVSKNNFYSCAAH